MALIKCPECGADISDSAVQCPKCGHKFSSQIQCPDCGSFFSEELSACPTCGAPNDARVDVAPENICASQDSTRICPDSNMVKAILCTLFCCLPGGIVAMVYANKVNSYWMQGRYNEAEDAAKSASNWCNFSLFFGGLTVIGYIFYWCAVLGGR